MEIQLGPEVPQHLEHSWWEWEVGEERHEWEMSAGEILAASGRSLQHNGEESQD